MLASFKTSRQKSISTTDLIFVGDGILNQMTSGRMQYFRFEHHLAFLVPMESNRYGDLIVQG